MLEERMKERLEIVRRYLLPQEQKKDDKTCP